MSNQQQLKQHLKGFKHLQDQPVRSAIATCDIEIDRWPNIKHSSSQRNIIPGSPVIAKNSLP